MTQANKEFTGLMLREEEQEVLENITITPQGIPIEENTISQFHSLPGSIRGSLGWMRYKDK